MFDGDVLLITGGTGSFGKAVLKRFLDSKIREIRIFSRDEKKQEDMRRVFRSPKLKFYIGSICACKTEQRVRFFFSINPSL